MLYSEVSFMDKSIEIALLYDFYGGLLTEKQREYIELRYNDDLSLTEIAEAEGVSRQGARDALLRAEKTLRDAEAETGLYARFGTMAADVDRLCALARKLEETAEGTAAETAAVLAAALEKMKGQIADGV